MTRFRPARDAQSAARSAEQLALETGDNDAWCVAEDAWREAGNDARAEIFAELRPSARRRALRTIGRAFIRGVEDGLWLDAWARAKEEAGERTPQSITRETADAAPPEVGRLARTFTRLLVRLNKTNLGAIYLAASLADDRLVDAERLGWDLMMHTLGHGISWTDNHACFPIRLPSGDANVWPISYPAARVPRIGRWGFEGYVTPRFARPMC